MMLQNQSEIRIATKMSAVLTKALAVAMDETADSRPDPTLGRGKRPTLHQSDGGNLQQVLKTISV